MYELCVAFIMIVGLYVFGCIVLFIGMIYARQILAEKSIEDAQAFVKFFIPAIRHWPLLVFVTMPKAFLAERRK